MVKYLILGNGFIGNKFQEYFNNLEEIGGKEEESVIGQRRINSIKDIYLELATYKPEIILNCIGKTGKPNIDWCESNREITFFSNVTVPTLLAEVCKDVGIYLVHIGSGCIYEGLGKNNNGFTEKDKPNFKDSFYSRSKIFSEQILNNYDNILILRIRMPIDSKPSDRNLITKLVRYKEVIGDIPNSITYLLDLMKVSKELMDRKESGIYNVVNDGTITHREILELYKEIVNPTFKLPKFIGLEELKKLTLAGRSNCTLSTEKLYQKGIKIRDVKDALKECLQEYRKYVKGI